MFTMEIVAGMLAVIGGRVLGHIMSVEKNGNYAMIEYKNGDVTSWAMIDMRQVAVA